MNSSVGSGGGGCCWWDKLTQQSCSADSATAALCCFPLFPQRYVAIVGCDGDVAMMTLSDDGCENYFAKVLSALAVLSTSDHLLLKCSTLFFYPP